MARGNDERNNPNRKVGREYFASTSYTGVHPQYGPVSRVDENEYYTEDDLPEDWDKMSSVDKEDWLNNTATGGPDGRTFPVPTAWTSGWSSMNYPEGVESDSQKSEEIDDWFEDQQIVQDGSFETTMHERGPNGEWVEMPDPKKGSR